TRRPASTVIPATVAGHASLVIARGSWVHRFPPSKESCRLPDEQRIAALAGRCGAAGSRPVRARGESTIARVVAVGVECFGSWRRCILRRVEAKLPDAPLPVALSHRIEPLYFAAPLQISGYVFESMPAVVVELSDGVHTGRGEAAGVYYLDDRPQHFRATIETHRGRIESGITRDELREFLPPGGARNALDCALWELEAQRAGVTPS